MINHLLRATTVALLGLLLVACDAETSDATSRSEYSLRVYEVPDGYRSEQIKQTLEALMPKDEQGNRQGEVIVAPNGDLLIGARPAVLDGAEQVLVRLKNSQPESKATYQLSFWLVRGQAADQREVPRELSAVSDSMQAIADSQPPMRYELLESLSTRVAEAEYFSLESSLTQISGQFSLTGPDAKLELKARWSDLDDETGAATGLKKVRTQLQFSTNQTLVLGQFGDAGGGVHFLLIRLGDEQS